jgi:intracellular septation protein A
MLNIFRAYYNWLKTAPVKTHVAITIAAMILFGALQFVLSDALFVSFVTAVCLLYIIPARVTSIGNRSRQERR